MVVALAAISFTLKVIFFRWKSREVGDQMPDARRNRRLDPMPVALRVSAGTHADIHLEWSRRSAFDKLRLTPEQRRRVTRRATPELFLEAAED